MKLKWNCFFDNFQFVEQITRAHFLVLGSPRGRAKGGAAAVPYVIIA